MQRRKMEKKYAKTLIVVYKGLLGAIRRLAFSVFLSYACLYPDFNVFCEPIHQMS